MSQVNDLLSPHKEPVPKKSPQFFSTVAEQRKKVFHPDKPHAAMTSWLEEI